MKEYCTRYVTSQFTPFFIPYFLPDNYAYVSKAFPDEPKLDMLLINIPVLVSIYKLIPIRKTFE
jgi:hypothetical protein